MYLNKILFDNELLTELFHSRNANLPALESTLLINFQDYELIRKKNTPEIQYRDCGVGKP